VERDAGFLRKHDLPFSFLCCFLFCFFFFFVVLFFFFSFFFFFFFFFLFLWRESSKVALAVREYCWRSARSRAGLRNNGCQRTA